MDVHDKGRERDRMSGRQVSGGSWRSYLFDGLFVLCFFNLDQNL
jgi:hypothetical protein